MPASPLQRFRRYLLSRIGVASSQQMQAVHAALEQADRRAAVDLRQVTKRLDRLEHKLESLLEKVDGVDAVLRRGRLRKVDDNVDALVRHAFLTGTLPQPQATLVRRFRGLSQNEEDGVTLALLEQVGVTTRRFVEIGAGVNGGNSGFLARECGWTGLMLEIDPERVRTLRRRFGPAVTAVQAQVTRENIDGILVAHGATGEVDLLSVDIDGIDYWVWDAISVCRPRLVIAEYNPSFGASRAVTVPYDAAFDRHRFDVGRAAYYGASLPALAGLGARKGYRLVAVEPRGVNAFFLREELAGDMPRLPYDRVALALERDDAVDPDALFAQLQAAGLDLVDVG